MRLRRRPRLRVRLLWDRGVVVAVALFLNSEFVGSVPLLASAGSLTVLADGVTLEHGGDRAPEARSLRDLFEPPSPRVKSPGEGGQTGDAEHGNGRHSLPEKP